MTTRLQLELLGSNTGRADDTDVVATNQATGRRGRLALVLGVALTGGALWALLTYVISDADLALEYVRALIWPTVILVALFWLRLPLREKVSQLLRLDALGASMEFSPEAQGRELDEAIRPDVTNLLQTQDPANGSTDEGETVVAPDTAGTPTHADESVPPDEEHDSPPKSVDGGALMSAVIAAHVAGMIEVAIGVGLPKELVDSLYEEARQNPDTARKRVLNSVTSHFREQRNRAVHRQEGARDSIEAVIRKSAAWGYDMGRAGAPKAVPDIEWNDDGTWHITTEIPKGRRSTARSSEEARLRHIKDLEDEIKKQEQLAHSAVGLAMPGRQGWLRQLKDRLARIDPDNPWATD